MAGKSVNKSPDRSRRLSEDKVNRYKYGGYVESPAKLARQFEEAVERNRQRSAEQREELQRRAKIREWR
jgi:hypothetical protein